MEILVTGAGGFLGRGIVDALRARGHDCAAPGVDGPRVDLTDAGVADRLLDQFDSTETLVHAAWYGGADRLASARNTDWVGHTGRLVEAFLESGGRRVVTIGTCFEYELGGGPLVEDETPLRPHTIYGEAKLAMASDVRTRCDAAGATAIHARVGFVYGPGEQPPRLVPSLLETLLEGRRFATTSGTQRRDYLHVDDVGTAIAALAEADVDGACNIGSGVALPVADLVTAFARAVDGLDRVDFGALEQRPGDPDSIELSIQRLRALGWQPEVSLDEGVHRTVQAMYPERFAADPHRNRSNND